MTTAFSSYILNVVTVGILAFFCEWILCAKDSTGAKKGVSLICGLCIIITVLLPFCSGMKKLLSGFFISMPQEVSEDNSSYTEMFYEKTQIQAKADVEKLIFDSFGIIPTNTSIQLNEVKDGFLTWEITVILSQNDAHLTEKITKLLKDSGFNLPNVKTEEAYDETQ